jgi:hypothetical protein
MQSFTKMAFNKGIFIRTLSFLEGKSRLMSRFNKEKNFISVFAELARV